MLPKFMSPFKGEGAQEEKQKQLKKKKKKLVNNQKRKTSACDDHDDNGGGGRSQTSMDVIGLKLVTKITNLQTKSNNVVVKSALRKANTTNTTTANNSTPLDSCFLKTCSLCNKKLSHDKDIYMYRGDQGFCSIECRNRQIVMDEMRQLEGSTKQRASSSYRNCWNDARLETRLILEDLRLQRLQSKPISCAHHQNHWAIVS